MLIPTGNIKESQASLSHTASNSKAKKRKDQLEDDFTSGYGDQPGESLTQSLYATAYSEQTLPSGYYYLAKNMPRFSDMQSPRAIDLFKLRHTDSGKMIYKEKI
ncbi:hypothetical protein Bca4012_067274 [Brassica carinata]|uniref:Uncharacterized protein n=1 Tax=Brassica carinata TaxID=52824 RepID=A0A8X8AZR5_BRACI|nr:hypothetical protein Bca52824_019510 [Brassica carinata]